MLCIRISEGEYEGLKATCKARGSGSISDIAREAVSRLIDSPKNTPDWLRRVEEIDGRIEALKQDLTRLQRLHEGPSSDTQDDLLSLKATNST
jgi:hypothetical protein